MVAFISCNDSAERRRRRKRQRPGLCTVIACAVAAAGPQAVTAFSPTISQLSQTLDHPSILRASAATTTETPVDRKQQQRQYSNNNSNLERLLQTLDDGEASTICSEASSSSSLPPWLERYALEAALNDNGANEQQEDIPIEDSLPELKDLKLFLSANGFSSNDIDEILQTMLFYTNDDNNNNNNALLRGMIDFVQLILHEQCHFESVTASDNSEDNKEETLSTIPNMHRTVFASKPVILAGIVHFAECVAARQGGVYDWLAASRQQTTATRSHNQLPSSSKDAKRSLLALPLQSAATSIIPITNTNNKPSPSTSARYPPHLTPTARKIASSAATIKRAEILANTILGVGTTRRLTKTEAESLQGLLLSSMEDWRALALRCIASLFRLEGILQQSQQQQLDDEDNDSSFTPMFPGLRSPEVVHTAQEAIMVYGTLAQRLGMYPLKAKLEERAFQILYQRQYRAVSSVYQQNRNAMHFIKTHLSSQMDGLLRSDASLMAHIDKLEVSSRVKEPYSFWKKLLKSKQKQQQQRLGESSGKTASNLSFTQVQDGIALRVILKAKKETPDEPEETTRAREKLLCYYVQHLIRQNWPGGDEDRVKDYIQFPKPNGYQSLHYTASLTYENTGQQFPFEVQVRSEEMHRIAEYGVAAHWDYKLASKPTTKDAETATDRKAMFAMEAAAEVVDSTDDTDDDSEDEVVEKKTVDVLPATTIAELDAIPQPFSFDEVIMDPSMVYNPPSLMISNKLINLKEQVASLQEPPARKKEQQVEYIDALVTARENLVQERVYVFVAGAASLTMEQGQLVILDSGSSIGDALDYIQKEAPEIFQQNDAVVEVAGGRRSQSSQPPPAAESGPRMPRVWRNGQQAQMDDLIRNGDVLLMEF